MYKLKNFFKDKQDNIIISFTIIGVAIIIFVLPELRDNVEFDKTERQYYKTYYLEKGKNIGRNTMMKYLYEENELDSNVIIDVNKLMEIEEEIENKTLNKINEE